MTHRIDCERDIPEKIFDRCACFRLDFLQNAFTLMPCKVFAEIDLFHV